MQTRSAFQAYQGNLTTPLLSREGVARSAGVVLVKKSFFLNLTNTTPSARISVASQYFFIAHPPLLC
jgi:hypothetical protein